MNQLKFEENKYWVALKYNKSMIKEVIFSMFGFVSGGKYFWLGKKLGRKISSGQNCGRNSLMGKHFFGQDIDLLFEEMREKEYLQIHYRRIILF